jgi:hypothetical protein
MQPYPPSSFITGCTIDPAVTSIPAHVERPGDNWPVTWAEDDQLYSFWADGDGFTPFPHLHSMYPCKISGSPEHNNVTGSDIATNETGKGLGGGGSGKKVSGIISIPDPKNPASGMLVAWVRNANAEGGASVMYSQDHGANWRWAWGNPDTAHDAILPELGHPSWMQAGKNNSSAPDNFLYFYCPNKPKAYQCADTAVLGRVKKTVVLDKSKYEYFCGSARAAAWSFKVGQAGPVFIATGQCYRLFVTYNPFLKRYFLLTANGDSMSEAYQNTHNLGIYESKNPWGPWFTVYWNNAFLPDWNVWGPQMVSKWIKPDDGTLFYMAYSCFDKGPYKFNYQKVTLKTARK